MRRLVFLACLISLLCLPVAVIRADEDAKPQAAVEKTSDDVKQEETKPSEVKKETKKSKKKKDAAKKEAKVETKPKLVVLTIKGEYPEGSGAPGLFSELQPSLANVIQRLDAAVTDKDVVAVWLKIENPVVGRGKVNEFRGAIARLRKANKPVYAELSSGMGPQYLLASSCDRIMMPPSGMLLIPGVRAEVTFLKGLLDKIGLQFDALQMGKYKGAAEPLTRSEMSEPLRESVTAVVDDIYGDLVATIAADRNLKDYQVKTYLDQGLYTAKAAQKVGLIDELLYSDQIEDAIKKAIKNENVEVVKNYKKQQIDTDFSGFSGMMKLFEMFTGGKTSETAEAKQKIAVVYAVGPIMEGKSKGDMFGGQSTVGSTTTVAALKEAADDEKVSAIVLRIDSPGGSAIASDLIWRETMRIQEQTKKPVIASMGDVAGSGGYYIAMGAKKIIAAPGTVTGSIGVIGGKLVLRGLFDKIGVTTEVISRGANSGSLSPTQPFTPEERKAWTELLEETYHQFVAKAAEGRKMPYEKLDEIAQGRVYTGRMAKELGLIDELGTLQDAVVAAKTAAGLKADAEVEIMVLPKPKSVFEQLFGDPSASTDLESLLPDDFRVLQETKLMRELFSERVLYWMPYGLQLQ